MSAQELRVYASLVSGYADPALPSVGENIRRLRIAAGFKNQGKFAAELNVPQPRLSDWENDRYGVPEVGNLLKIAKKLKVSIDELLVGVDGDYDAILRDLPFHSAEYKSASHQEVADVSTAARVRELQGRIEQFESLVPEIKGVLTKLANIAIAAHEQDRPARRAAPGGRGRHRRAG